MSARKVPSIPQYGCRLRVHKSYSQQYFLKYPYIKFLADMCEQEGHPCVPHEEGRKHSTPMLSARNFIYAPALLELAEDSFDYSNVMIAIMSSLETVNTVNTAFQYLSGFVETFVGQDHSGEYSKKETMLVAYSLLYAFDNAEHLRSLCDPDLPEEIVSRMFAESITESLRSFHTKG